MFFVFGDFSFVDPEFTGFIVINLKAVYVIERRAGWSYRKLGGG